MLQRPHRNRLPSSPGQHSAFKEVEYLDPAPATCMSSRITPSVARPSAMSALFSDAIAAEPGSVHDLRRSTAKRARLLPICSRNPLFFQRIRYLRKASQRQECCAGAKILSTNLLVRGVLAEQTSKTHPLREAFHARHR